MASTRDEKLEEQTVRLIELIRPRLPPEFEVMNAIESRNGDFVEVTIQVPFSSLATREIQALRDEPWGSPTPVA